MAIGHAAGTAILDVRRGDASGKIAEFHTSTGYGIEIGSSQADAYISSGYAQNFQFKTGNTATTRMTILNAGNVGIGTSSPAGSGLHVHNSSAGEQYISSSNSAMRFVSTGGINYIQSGTATSSSSAAPLVFTNVGGSGETMRIDSSGNVGIGNSSPATGIDVQTTNYTYSGTTYDIYGIVGLTSGGVRLGGDSSNADSVIGTTGTGNMQFVTYNGSAWGSRMTLDNSGKFGIGTSSPAAPMSVMADTSADVPAAGAASSHLAVGKNEDFGTMIGTINNGAGYIQQQRFDGTGTKYALHIQPNNGTVTIGSTAKSTSQFDATLSVRDPGAAIEFGHNNQAGYGSTIGALANNGFPFIAFYSEPATTTSNAFRTRGLKGAVLSATTSGDMTFSRVPLATADDQVPVESMRIDASGNLLVGQTTNAETGTGIGLVPDGTSHMYSASTDALMLGRGGSDGDILSFNKSGSTIGSLATYSSTMQVGQGNAYLKFANATDTITPANGNGTDNDAALSLGKADARFSSLYLSGTVYAKSLRSIGANGVANEQIIAGISGVSNGHIINQSAANELTYKWHTGANAQGMTFTNDGNLLVGKTAIDSDAVGFQVDGSNGKIAATVSGAEAARFVRTSSDGEIVRLVKDTTVVGSIGVDFTDNLYIGGNTTHSGLMFSADEIYPYRNGTYRNNEIDLGASAGAFRYAYIQSGIYLGGTAAANLLDDYEEGTWTPVLRGASTAGTPSVGTLVGSYVKIGKLVTITLRVTNLTLSGGSGAIQITGIPFTATTAGSNHGTAPFSMTHEINFDGDKNQNWYMGSSYMLGLESQGGGVWSDLAVTNSSAIYLNQTITYEEA